MKIATRNRVKFFEEKIDNDALRGRQYHLAVRPAEGYEPTCPQSKGFPHGEAIAQLYWAEIG